MLTKKQKKLSKELEETVELAGPNYKEIEQKETNTGY